MVETTKLTPANIANSLRTTVPMAIVRQMGLSGGDRLEWEMDKIGGEWIATIRKKE